MATFWETAARSVSNLLSLYFVYLLYLFIPAFGFKSGICLLIAPVPVLLLFYYLYKKSAYLRIFGVIIVKFLDIKFANH